MSFSVPGMLQNEGGSAQPPLFALKPELCCDLADTRIGRFSDETEGATLVADVTVD
jgi:hypothetical protein